jgi:hypothetical protein
MACVTEVVAPALAQLEAELAAVLDERRDEIVGQLARILVADGGRGPPRRAEPERTSARA